jgi:hypothetical protein
MSNTEKALARIEAAIELIDCDHDGELWEISGVRGQPVTVCGNCEAVVMNGDTDPRYQKPISITLN